MVGVELAQNLLVEGGARGFNDTHVAGRADRIDALPGCVKGGLVFADALNADLGLLVHRVADRPLDDSEVDAVLLAHVDALAESVLVEKMADQADGEALQVVAL
uniref:Uncharacterized protein n=1 Tax=Strombidinopsis acuminata TaxID=141414 RepID=A0A7S3RLE1_9SPIT